MNKRSTDFLNWLEKVDYSFFVFLYFFIGLILIIMLILIKNIILGTFSGYLHPYLSVYILFLLICMSCFFHKKFILLSANQKIALLFLLGFGYNIITQVYLVAFSVIFTTFSLILLITCTFIIFINRFNHIKLEIQEFKKIENWNEIKLKQLEFLNADVRYWLDKTLTIIYWVSTVVVASMTILWGLASKNEITYELNILSSEFLIFYFYILIGVIYWIFIPIYHLSISIRDLNSLKEAKSF